MIPSATLGVWLREIPLHEVSFLAFSQNLNTGFRVEGDGGASVELRLIEASPQAPSLSTVSNAEDALNEQFSLLFIGPLQPALSQGTYWFEHHRIGRFAMFVVPVGPQDTGYSYYEAVFNRAAARLVNHPVRPDAPGIQSGAALPNRSR
jgi:hypothetical protein